MAERSPEWWLDTLSKRLEAKRRDSCRDGVFVPGLDLLWRYYEGEPRLPVGAENAREAYVTFMRQARTNFAELIVEAVRDRMQPVGFRTGSADDKDGDEQAWRIWQANRLDADSAIAHRMALAMGEAYAIVGGQDEDTGEPLVTIEDPRHAICAWDPANRRRLRAALKWYRDEDEEREFAHLYWRDKSGVYLRNATRSSTALQRGAAGGWEWDTDVQSLPVRRIPFARFVSRPDSWGNGRGEFAAHLDVLDRINTQVLHRLVVVAMQTFRQRALQKEDGVELPERDEDGERIDYDKVFEASPAALWDLPAGITIWESSMTDLQPILQAVRADVQDLAAVTRTPMHYLMPEGANQSAEGASLTREGLVSKVHDRIAAMSEGWESVISLAFEWKGDSARASIVDTECLWREPEQFSLTQKSSAVAQLGQYMPWRMLAETVMQLSPQEVARYDAERQSDVLFADLNTATAAPQNATSQP